MATPREQAMQRLREEEELRRLAAEQAAMAEPSNNNLFRDSKIFGNWFDPKNYTEASFNDSNIFGNWFDGANYGGDGQIGFTPNYNVFVKQPAPYDERLGMEIGRQQQMLNASPGFSLNNAGSVFTDMYDSFTAGREVDAQLDAIEESRKNKVYNKETGMFEDTPEFTVAKEREAAVKAAEEARVEDALAQIAQADVDEENRQRYIRGLLADQNRMQQGQVREGLVKDPVTSDQVATSLMSDIESEKPTESDVNIFGDWFDPDNYTSMYEAAKKKVSEFIPLATDLLDLSTAGQDPAKDADKEPLTMQSINDSIVNAIDAAGAAVSESGFLEGETSVIRDNVITPIADKVDKIILDGKNGDGMLGWLLDSTGVTGNPDKTKDGERTLTEEESNRAMQLLDDEIARTENEGTTNVNNTDATSSASTTSTNQGLISTDVPSTSLMGTTTSSGGGTNVFNSTLEGFNIDKLLNPLTGQNRDWWFGQRAGDVPGNNRAKELFDTLAYIGTPMKYRPAKTPSQQLREDRIQHMNNVMDYNASQKSGTPSFSSLRAAIPSTSDIGAALQGAFENNKNKGLLFGMIGGDSPEDVDNRVNAAALRIRERMVQMTMTNGVIPDTLAVAEMITAEDQAKADKEKRLKELREQKKKLEEEQSGTKKSWWSDII
tara:strand:- start:1024 stop:3009 length:1986 start_codon:yes stop_codon:yes gene_type:complete